MNHIPNEQSRHQYIARLGNSQSAHAGLSTNTITSTSRSNRRFLWIMLLVYNIPALLLQMFWTPPNHNDIDNAEIIFDMQHKFQPIWYFQSTVVISNTEYLLLLVVREARERRCESENTSLMDSFSFIQFTHCMIPSSFISQQLYLHILDGI